MPGYGYDHGPARGGRGANGHADARRATEAAGPSESHTGSARHGHPVALGLGRLSIADVVAVAREGAHVRLAPAAVERVQAARAVVDRITGEGRTVYGITTGFGHLSRIKIPPEQLAELQHNLIRSHASGVGEPFDIPATRAVLLLLANSLARGHSGVRLELLELLVGMLNSGVTPVVPTRGSVGASGDLAPLAHLALVVIGEGEAAVGGDGSQQRLPGAQALARVGLAPLILSAKEGLALINGTHVMAAIGALKAHDGWRLLRAAEVAAAMSLEALLGSFVPFDARISALRPQPGQARTAARMRALLDGSELNPSHADCGRVQDPYSLRCIPQVLGTTRDALAYCSGVFAAELESVTDNPLIFPGEPGDGADSGEDDAVLSGGNFHGEPLALALDMMALALGQMASFSERRTFSLLGPHDWDTGEHALPLFLTPEPGLRSGYMIAQYAAAALVNEIQVLAHPASIGSIPTSANMEDFVSMGATAALKLERVLAAAREVVAIELLCAAQGLDFRQPLRPGRVVQTALERVRELVPTLTTDRPPAPDIARLAAAIEAGRFDDLVPEEQLAAAPHRARRATSNSPNGNSVVSSPRREREHPGADRHGRGRH
jgi:histidine ammonia-lyase